MRALMYTSNRDVRVCELPLPEIGPGEILMRVMASGICGSDVMEWYRRDKVPLVLGHEVAGDVAAVGPGVQRFKPGDRIAATHHVPCNTCHYCLSGHHTVCDTLLRGTRFHPGGFAEYLRLPVLNVDRGTFPIADTITYGQASFMEPLACVLRGQRNAGLKCGQSVLVLGAGISGLLHVALARALGAGLVVAGDTLPFRLEKAREMGADLALPADETLLEGLRRHNQGRGADLVILCFEGFLSLALRAVERGGTVLLFAGASEGATLPGTLNDLFWRTEITLTSTYAGSPADCRTALDLIEGGRVPVEKTITHCLSLEEGIGAFEGVACPTGRPCVKVILEPHRGRS